jgi:hypothetical protein
MCSASSFLSKFTGSGSKSSNYSPQNSSPYRPHQQAPAYSAPSASISSSSSSSNHTYESNHDSSSAPRRRGAPGGVWGNTNSSVSNTGSQHQYGSAPASASAPSASPPVHIREAQQDTGELETKMVDHITRKAGVSLKPPVSELSKFISASVSLNHYILADLLNRKLRETYPVPLVMLFFVFLFFVFLLFFCYFFVIFI